MKTDAKTKKRINRAKAKRRAREAAIAEFVAKRRGVLGLSKIPESSEGS